MGFVWLANEQGVAPEDVRWVVFGFALFAGLESLDHEVLRRYSAALVAVARSAA